jgi:hypothetical protein
VGRSLKRPAQRLVPGLGRYNPQDLLLAVADIEVELAEELFLRKRVGWVDAQVGQGPRRGHAGRAADLNPAPNAEAIGETVEQSGREVQVALDLKLLPERLTERSPCYLAGALVCQVIILPPEVPAGGAPRNILPAAAPRQLDDTRLARERTGRANRYQEVAQFL